MTRSQSREQSENNRNNITQVKQEMKDEIFNAMSKVGMVLPFYSPVQAKEKYKNQGDKLEKEKTKIMTRLRNKKDQLIQKLETSKGRRKFDKVSLNMSSWICNFIVF